MGAAVLCANSALRVGSGLVTLCVPREIRNAVNSMSLEVIVDSLASVDKDLLKAQAVAIGPGLKTSSQTLSMVKKVLLNRRLKAPVVLDADALNVIKDPAIFKTIGEGYRHHSSSGRVLKAHRSSS